MDKPKKVTKRTLQAEATKEKIIQATMALMEKFGFADMTIQDIHKKAGISVGTFYHYYSTKEDVFFELYRKADEYFKKEVLPDLEEGNRSCVEKIILFFKHYGVFNESHGIEFSKHLYSPNNKMFIDQDRFMISLLLNIVKEGQESGEISQARDAEDIMKFLLIFSRGLIFDWCIHDGDYNLPERIVNDIGMIMTIFTA